MSLPAPYVFDPKLDLDMERVVDAPPHLIWAAWTRPKHLVHWFCPRPWRTTHAEIDLRPGGKFRTVMRGPEGQEFDNNGCYLDVVENQRLTWTSTMTAGYRPSAAPEHALHMTAMILIEPHGAGSKYRAVVIHASEQDARKHADMGFPAGWDIALDQLLEHMGAVSP